MRRELTKLIFLFAASLSLAGSAIAACACSHHLVVQENESLSCHTASHETAANEESQVPPGDFVNESCRCFVRYASPAINSKVETKNSKAKQHAAESIDSFAIADLKMRGSTFRTLSFIPVDSRYSDAHVRSGPSRAPPCL